MFHPYHCFRSGTILQNPRLDDLRRPCPYGADQSEPQQHSLGRHLASICSKWSARENRPVQKPAWQREHQAIDIQPCSVQLQLHYFESSWQSALLHWFIRELTNLTSSVVDKVDFWLSLVDFSSSMTRLDADENRSSPSTTSKGATCSAIFLACAPSTWPWIISSTHH